MTLFKRICLFICILLPAIGTAATMKSGEVVVTNWLYVAKSQTNGGDIYLQSGAIPYQSGVVSNMLIIGAPTKRANGYEALQGYSGGATSRNSGIHIVSQSRASRTNGLLLGDLGDAGDSISSDDIQIGLLRNGWSGMFTRNWKYNTNGQSAPVSFVASETHTPSIAEVGSEGFSVHGWDLTKRTPNGSGGLDGGHMMFSVRPYARRVWQNDYGLTDGERDGPWIQFHTPVYARYWTNIDWDTYQSYGIQPMIWLDSPAITNDNPVLRLGTFGGTNARPIEFRGGGGTPETNTIVSTNQVIMDLVAKSYDGNEFQKTARIFAQVAGPPYVSSIGDNNLPTKIVFQTTSGTSALLTNKLIIWPANNVTINSEDPRGNFHVTTSGENSSGLYPANLGSPNNHAAILGDTTEVVGSSGATYGVIGVARGNGDSGSARAYGGWFNASSGGSETTQVGIRAMVADPGAMIAEFYQGGNKKVGILGSGIIHAVTNLNVGGVITITNTLTILGTTNQITFGSTNLAPATTATPDKWVSVQINGESTTYRLPLYK